MKNIPIFISVALFSIANFVLAEDADFIKERKAMVEEQVKGRGITDRKVLDAMLKVERHRFVLEGWQSVSYIDGPLPIGEGQTISQPYIVALMTEIAALKKEDKVLEIGTGSGYQAAILAELSAQVYTIEIIGELAKKAENLLTEIGYRNIKVKEGDGYLGWPEYAPFDVIIVTCAPKKVPEKLVEQLIEGGRMVLPVGEEGNQILKLLVKESGRIIEKDVIPVRFVPMVQE